MHINDIAQLELTEPVTEQQITPAETEDEEVSAFGYDLTDPENAKFTKYLKHLKKRNPDMYKRISSLG